MNRTLRRPMFRIGGTAEGITSGLSRQGYQGTDNAADQRVQQAPRRNTGISDFLISFGLDLASRPKGGNIFQQVATSARDPFKQFQATRAAQEDRDWKREWEQGGRDIESERFKTEVGLKKQEIGLKEDEQTYIEARDKADRELQKYLGEIDAKGKIQWIVEEIDKHWDKKILTAEVEGKSEEDIAEMRAQKTKDRYKALQGYDISDTMAILRNTAAFEKAEELARGQLQATINTTTGEYWLRSDKGFADAVIELTKRYLRQIADFLQEEERTDEERTDEAEGGRIGYQNAGAVMPGQPTQAQGETNQINISYEQLRERLPPEISNEIVLLLSKSYEAFADFAEIQTQADVNEFNTKYNVQLFLPKQAEA